MLIGHSFGGRVALATAGWNADRAAAVVLVDFAPDIAAAGRRATAERIGRQPDLFASVDEALAFHDEDDTRPLRARYEAFLKPAPAVFSSGAICIFATISGRRSRPASRPRCRLLLADAGGAELPALVIRARNRTCSTRQRLPK